MKTYPHSALLIASLLVLSSNLPAIGADAKQSAKDSPWKAELEKLQAEQKVKKAEVLQAAKELTGALLAGNVAAVDRMLARDYVEVYEEDVMMWDGRRIHLPPSPKKVPGKKRTRDDILSGLRSGALKFVSLQTTNEEVAIQANAAVRGGELVMFAARLVEKSSHHGKDTSGEFALTRNYEKKDGKWVCLDSNLNPLMPKP
jgi:calcineurin-like phosphoesterase family protein